MAQLALRRQRRWIGLGLVTITVFGIYWFFFSSGIPVMWGPTASAKDIAAGRELFEHEWTPNDPLAKGDGLGPVFNAKSCAACHFQGGLGGGGEISHNATGYEILPRPEDRRLLSGSIHNYSVDPADKESFSVLRKQFPIRKGRIESRIVAMENCPPSQQSVTIPDVDPIRTLSVQSTAIYGSGWLDRISEKAIVQNFRDRNFRNISRELGMKFDTIPVGKLRTLPDGRVGRFGWKAQFASLEDFVATACANEIGLGTPNLAQTKPITKSNAPEVTPDLDRKQFGQLMAFIETLPRPVEVGQDATAAKHGKELFSTIGCAQCHVPDLGGVKGVYTDFLMYTLDDPLPPGGGGGPYGPEPPAELPRPDDLPKPSEWKTPPLWGVADSAPYFHDGTAFTLHDAILRHDGDGKGVKKAYQELSKDKQAELVAFLNTLKAPPTATPLRDLAITKLPKKK
jgi:CxxC motif-containing protein (DUF1111 family)